MHYDTMPEKRHLHHGVSERQTNANYRQEPELRDPSSRQVHSNF